MNITMSFDAAVSLRLRLDEMSEGGQKEFMAACIRKTTQEMHAATLARQAAVIAKDLLPEQSNVLLDLAAHFANPSADLVRQLEKLTDQKAIDTALQLAATGLAEARVEREKAIIARSEYYDIVSRQPAEALADLRTRRAREGEEFAKKYPPEYDGHMLRAFHQQASRRLADFDKGFLPAFNGRMRDAVCHLEEAIVVLSAKTLKKPAESMQNSF